MVYLYNFIDKPKKTQFYLNKVMNELYTNTPEGLCGNEDCGQMSAWYILSSLGFHPICQGDNKYWLGSPLFTKAVINLDNDHYTGKTFRQIDLYTSNTN